MKRTWFSLWAAAGVGAVLLAMTVGQGSAARGQAGEGSGTRYSSSGPCPLKHTDVTAEISGFLARVTVTQEFRNPYQEKIEAVYTFPLPPKAAVDRMTMQVGDRTIRGSIKRREEARAAYEAARSSGRTASLLVHRPVNSL